MPPLRALVLPLALALAACGDDDTLEAYSVRLTPISDCEQSGVGAVNCVDESQLSSVHVTGRWLFDYRGSDTFVLLTQDGRTLPGVYFANDGRVQTSACTGGGGVCHFARVRSAEDEPGSGCLRQQQRLVDLTVVDGELSGVLFDETFTDDACDAPFVRQLRVALSGTLVEEDVLAREEYADDAP